LVLVFQHSIYPCTNTISSITREFPTTRTPPPPFDLVLQHLHLLLLLHKQYQFHFLQDFLEMDLLEVYYLNRLDY
jgi:hypothetical protein